MRLVAALGILAIAALATGGLATLTANRSVRADAAAPTGPSPVLPHLLDPAHLVQDRVEQAEHAQTRARAALRSARQLGLVDPGQLDRLEHRLEGSVTSSASGLAGPARPAEASASSPSEALASGHLDPRPRSL